MLDSRSVSRLHALIQRRESGEYNLVDLGSRNGSFVNRKRVSLPVALKDGDRIAVGDQELFFWNPAPVTGGIESDFATRNAPTTALHRHSIATIAVVDIRDFTRLARSLPEPVLSQLIGTWFLRAGQIAQQQGSWAQKYIGDAVMAVWVHDDAGQVPGDVRRVLEYIDRLAEATEEIGSSLPPGGSLRIGAGVNTGPAIVGGAEYTALGDTVNAAFRLESASKQLGVGILIGSATYDALPTPVVTSPFKSRQVELKGYEAPARAWAVSFVELRQYLAAGA
jgi:adenylate cyclase